MRLALRNLFRNRWRTGLTVGGVAVAVAMVVWTTAMMEAFLFGMVRAATQVQLGDVQIHAASYVDEPSIFHSFDVDAATLARLDATAGVVGASPRIGTFGLVGTQKRSQVAMLLGVDAGREARVTRVAGGLSSGRWLSGGEQASEARMEVVLGETFARQLEAKVGDELVAMMQAADGSMGDALLEVVGITKSGAVELDRQAAWMRLPDLRYLTALDGKAHEIAVALARETELESGAAGVSHAMGERSGAGVPLTVRSWKQVVPELSQMVDMSRASVVLLYLIVYFVAGLGVLNTQRMSVLERRRELGVMLAIGVTPARLARLLAAETVLLTGVGALAGGLLGWSASAYHAVYGFDMAALGEGAGTFTYQGVAFERLLYFQVGAETVLVPTLVVMVMGLVCGLWPGLAGARLDPVLAISGRT